MNTTHGEEVPLTFAEQVAEDRKTARLFGTAAGLTLLVGIVLFAILYAYCGRNGG